jgi:hypothetical protein
VALIICEKLVFGALCEYDPENPRNLGMDTVQGRKSGLGYTGVVVGAAIFIYGVYSLVA